MPIPIGGAWIQNGKAVNRVMIQGLVQMVLAALSNAIGELCTSWPFENNNVFLSRIFRFFATPTNLFVC